ncbi:MAG: PAQR family membrane homeostasis protein TrhA [Ignavibacteriales bacterium]
MMRTKFREPVSGLTHLFAALAALPGGAYLILSRKAGFTEEIPLLIYSFSLVFMLSASAAYHLINMGPNVTRILRKVDHSAIFILIAGTYTPICMNLFGEYWKWKLLVTVWVIAAAGIVLKIFFIGAPRWISTAVYLAMSWLSVLAGKEILSSFPTGAIMWLFIGGFFYTAGAIIYATKKLDLKPGVFGFHEVWHIFVILGCLSHFILIALYA